jgi:hypothetical protein
LESGSEYRELGGSERKIFTLTNVVKSDGTDTLSIRWNGMIHNRSEEAAEEGFPFLIEYRDLNRNMVPAVTDFKLLVSGTNVLKEDII